ASSLAGELYKLDILARDIEDVSFNYTRFFVLGHDDPPRGVYNKTSLCSRRDIVRQRCMTAWGSLHRAG
ncbi:MAG: prephenate dehydratase domain-containing protein, partial [Chloroflexota bacterium]